MLRRLTLRDAAVVVLIVLVAHGSIGCTSKACNGDRVTGLGVEVEVVATTKSVCNAQVVATDGVYREVLTSTLPSSDATDGGVVEVDVDAAFSGCWYYGAWERAGTYDITVSAPGFQTAVVRGVVVTQGECHVVSQSVTVPLTAN
jgi:hypothetical protein